MAAPLFQLYPLMIGTKNSNSHFTHTAHVIHIQIEKFQSFFDDQAAST